jgi:hypothetical protein
MKRILLLSSCLFVFVSWSTAQVGFLASMNRIDMDHTAEAVPRDNQANGIGATPDPIVIPTGTHLLMRLTSPLHTTSAIRSAGIYLETSFPVIVSNRVAIPEHTRVIGVVESERRPGRVQGRARMRLHFTQLILPDNHVLAITGNVQSLPGSSKKRAVDDEGTIEPVDQIDADVYTVAKTIGVGILIGSISHIGIGVGPGALMGAGLGLAKVLFTRGDDLSLQVGTQVEMVLQQPLTVLP